MGSLDGEWTWYVTEGDANAPTSPTGILRLNTTGEGECTSCRLQGEGDPVDLNHHLNQKESLFSSVFHLFWLFIPKHLRWNMTLQRFSLPFPGTCFIRAGCLIYQFKIRGGSSCRQDGRGCSSSQPHICTSVLGFSVTLFVSSSVLLCI